MTLKIENTQGIRLLSHQILPKECFVAKAVYIFACGRNANMHTGAAGL